MKAYLTDKAVQRIAQTLEYSYAIMSDRDKWWTGESWGDHDDAATYLIQDLPDEIPADNPELQGLWTLHTDNPEHISYYNEEDSYSGALVRPYK